MDILLIEDDAASAVVLEQLLRNDGHDVEIARNCRQAVAVFRQNYFDVLICDLNLPDGNGAQLLADLLKIRFVKAVALSRNAMMVDKIQSREAGFVAHLSKPITTSKLRRIIADIDCGRYDFPLFDREDFDLGIPRIKTRPSAEIA